ncbi:MAG TPA: ammonium transporter, partial [Alcanivorax sp.]|nr:ammonium transporter [Alcanivorax sp.]
LLLFQLMFAATAATIASGAMAERTRYLGYLCGAMLITGLVYPLFGNWAWNSDGWLAALGFIDFAGSTVVHSVGGWCALAGIMVVGPRLGRFDSQGRPREIRGHN